MKAIMFTLPGGPQGKGRPRYVQRTGRAYTPDKTVAYEELVRQRYLEAAKGLDFGEGPVCVIITAIFPIPKSFSKKKTEQAMEGTLYPTKKPDWDNIGKIICDALNGIAYKDDSQVVNAMVVKVYGNCQKVTVQMFTPPDGRRDDG